MIDSHWYCRTHDQVFKSKTDLHLHYRQCLDHHFCFDCEKEFEDEDTLWDHSVEEHHKRSIGTWLCWPPLFRNLFWLWMPDANDGERQKVNGASGGRAQGARGYGTV